MVPLLELASVSCSAMLPNLTVTVHVPCMLTVHASNDVRANETAPMYPKILNVDRSERKHRVPF